MGKGFRPNGVCLNFGRLGELRLLQLMNTVLVAEVRLGSVRIILNVTTRLHLIHHVNFQGRFATLGSSGASPS